MKIFYKNMLTLFFVILEVIFGQEGFRRKFRFFSKKYLSRVVNFEIASGVFDVMDINNALTDLVEANINTHDITLKTSLSTSNLLRFDGNSCFNFLCSVPNWRYMNNQTY